MSMLSTLDQKTAYIGNTWAFAHQVMESVNGAPATPFNLTGSTVTAAISGTPPIAATVIVITPATGQIEIQVPDTTTINIAPGAYLCDVLVTTASGVKRTSEQFVIIVKRAVTV